MGAWVNQTQHFGKGMRASPQVFTLAVVALTRVKAVLDDGLLDITLIQASTRGRVLKMFNEIPVGSHFSNPVLFNRQAKKVTLSYPNNLPGNLVSTLPLTPQRGC